jgi:hypothetical protein
MDLKIVNRVSQFPKIVDFEDLVEIRSGLFQLSFSYQKSVTRVQFWKSKFTLHHIYVGQSRTKYTKTNQSTKALEVVGRRDFMKHTKKPMSSLSHHDDDCNARDVATEPQTTDQLVD